MILKTNTKVGCLPFNVCNSNHQIKNGSRSAAIPHKA